MRWPWSKPAEQALVTNEAYAPIDTMLSGFFNPAPNYAGSAVNERSILGVSAFWRAVSLISGTLAGLPMKSYRDKGAGEREQVGSIFDDPDGPYGQTVFEWKETLYLHLLLHGRAGALKLNNAGGSLARLALVHPMDWSIEEPTGNENPKGGLWFRVNYLDRPGERYDADGFWYVPGMSSDGKHGLSLIDIARQNISSAIAGDNAQARMFGQGALMAGLVSPTDDTGLEEDEVKTLRRELDNNVQGQQNAGKLAIVSRKLNFTPWTMTAVDAQFLQSRQFSIEDVARWTGIPPHLLMQTEKQTSWGTGVNEQNRGLSKFVLGGWASRVEQRASRLLAAPRWVEFDFAGLERPNTEVEIDLLIKQVGAGLLTINEARKIRNLPPLPEPAPKEEPVAPPAE